MFWKMIYSCWSLFSWELLLNLEVLLKSLVHHLLWASNQKSKFVGNHASKEGDAIHLSQTLTKSEISLINNSLCYFYNNTASIGAVFFVDVHVDIINRKTRFIFNYAFGPGGCFLVQEANSILNIQSSFRLNYAKHDGGCLVLLHINYLLNVRSLFLNNSCGLLGGTIYIKNGTYLSNNRSCFMDNTANGGAAFYVSFLDCVWSLNSKYMNHTCKMGTRFFSISIG